MGEVIFFSTYFPNESKCKFEPKWNLTVKKHNRILAERLSDQKMVDDIFFFVFYVLILKWLKKNTWGGSDWNRRSKLFFLQKISGDQNNLSRDRKSKKHLKMFLLSWSYLRLLNFSGDKKSKYFWSPKKRQFWSLEQCCEKFRSHKNANFDRMKNDNFDLMKFDLLTISQHFVLIAKFCVVWK